MTTNQTSQWQDKRTDESRSVESILQKAGFNQVDAYRYNSASLRVRVVDERFESIPREDRDRIVEPFIDQLPLSTQADIVMLVLLAPSEIEKPSAEFRESALNAEFENPSPTML